MGGHIIMLGPNCENAAIEALNAYPMGMQIGGNKINFVFIKTFTSLESKECNNPIFCTLLGGITTENAIDYLDHGASHVIVTSFVFSNGQVDFNRLETLSNLVGKSRLVIDLSCRKRVEDPSGPFYVVTNKWTKYTEFCVT